jgi:hypothetical protein
MIDLSGMTMNERLFELGLDEEFDRAIADRDREALVEIYLKTGSALASAEKSADTILSNPDRYRRC